MWVLGTKPGFSTGVGNAFESSLELPENNCGELVLSFHHVGLRNRKEGKLGSKRLHKASLAPPLVYLYTVFLLLMRM